MIKGYKTFLIHNWDKVLLFLLVAIYIYTLGTLSVARHNSFASLYDLSNMDQTLWHTLNGNFFSLRYPEELLSRFAVHADLILVLLSPLYLIHDDVRMLILSESFLLGIGAIPTFFLAQKILKDKIMALITVCIYLLNPGMQWTDMYDFHAVSLAIPFLLAVLYFAHIRKWGWYWVFVILSIITKEQISLVIAMIGIFLFTFLRQKKIGIITLVFGVTWFVGMVFVVMPYSTPEGSHWALHSQGETNFLLVIKKFLDPSFVLSNFFSKASIDYYILLLKPFSFVPLVGIPWLLMSLPDLMINVVRGTTSIHFHYDSGTTPGLIIGLIYGLGHIFVGLKTIGLSGKTSVNLVRLISIGILLVALRVNYNYSPLPTTPSCWCDFYQPSTEDREYEKLLNNLPPDASVTASVEIKSHITHREFAYGIPSATESADYIALLTHNRIIGNIEPKDIENRLILELLQDPNYRAIFKGEYLYLFQNLKADKNKLPGR